MNMDFEWRIQKTECLQKIDVLYAECNRMSGKFWNGFEQEQLRDMIKLAQKNELEDAHFQILDDMSARDLEQGKSERLALEKMMKIYDLFSRSTIKEAETALAEGRAPRTKLTNDNLAIHVGERIVEKFKKMKREHPNSSGSTEGDRKRTKSVSKDGDQEKDLDGANMTLG